MPPAETLDVLRLTNTLTIGRDGKSRMIPHVDPEGSIHDADIARRVNAQIGSMNGLVFEQASRMACELSLARQGRETVCTFDNYGPDSR